MMNVLQLLAAFVRLGGTASAGEGADDGASARPGTGGTAPANGGGAGPHPMDRVRAEGRARRLGAGGQLTRELILHRLLPGRSTPARIASGGMRDQVRGGIARYSVDRQWFVPHFEKMLYDNSLYLRAVVAWAKVERALDPESKWLALAEREIADTANFLISDLSTDDGFIAALDADSLNSAGVSEEGAAYVFTPEQFAEAGQAGLLGLVDSPAGGELSGPVVAAEHPAPWDIAATKRQREVLEQLRARRSQPTRDTKIITEWNSLAVTALAEAALYSGAGAEPVGGADSTGSVGPTGGAITGNAESA
ncbi:hypothetical protein BAURA86_04078, partial [Brevibacterium aurantiacum]